jgi:hypothetical protein
MNGHLRTRCWGEDMGVWERHNRKVESLLV